MAKHNMQIPLYLFHFCAMVRIQIFIYPSQLIGCMLESSANQWPCVQCSQAVDAGFKTDFIEGVDTNVSYSSFEKCKNLSLVKLS